MKQRLLSAAISMLVVAVAAAGLATVPASSQEQSLVVTSTADSGPATLRDSLERATPGTTITFEPTIFPSQNPTTIGVTSPLPWLTQGRVTIDASNAGVILDGSELPHGEVIDGLVVTSSGNVIRGS